jgi:hypothetical protein
VFFISHAFQSSCQLSRCRVVIPCTVAFAPSADSAPMVPTMKYWNTLGPVSPPLLLYASNEGILVESLEPLKGLSNEEAEALRVCRAVQPALATGNWWAVHERAIARVVLARAGIVDADAGWVWMDGAVGEVVDVEVLAGALRVAAARLLAVTTGLVIGRMDSGDRTPMQRHCLNITTIEPHIVQVRVEQFWLMKTNRHCANMHFERYPPISCDGGCERL